jgi:hypothetical protein
MLEPDNGLNKANLFEITLTPMVPGSPEEVELLRVVKSLFKVSITLSVCSQLM